MELQGHAAACHQGCVAPIDSIMSQQPALLALTVGLLYKKLRTQQNNNMIGIPCIVPNNVAAIHRRIWEESRYQVSAVYHERVHINVPERDNHQCKGMFVVNLFDPPKLMGGRWAFCPRLDKSPPKTRAKLGTAMSHSSVPSRSRSPTMLSLPLPAAWHTLQVQLSFQKRATERSPYCRDKRSDMFRFQRQAKFSPEDCTSKCAMDNNAPLFAKS